MPGPEAAEPKFLRELEPQANLVPVPESLNGSLIKQLALLGDTPLVVLEATYQHPYQRVAVCQPGTEPQPIDLLGLNVLEIVANDLRSGSLAADNIKMYINSAGDKDTNEKYTLRMRLRKLPFEEKQREKILLLVRTLVAQGGLDNHAGWVDVNKLIGVLSKSKPVDVKLVLGEAGTMFVFAKGLASNLSLNNGKIEEKMEDMPTQIPGVNNTELNYLSAAGNLIVYRLDNKIMTVEDQRSAKDLYTVKTESAVLDKRDKPTLYLVSEDGREVQRLDLERLQHGIFKTETVDIALPLDAKIKKLDLDPNGNFLAVEYQTSAGGSIDIISKDSGEFAVTFKETTSRMAFDHSGNLIFVDNQNRVRKIQTNFDRIPTGGVAALEEARKKRLEELKAKIEVLRLPQVGESATGNRQQTITEEGVVKQLENKVTAAFAASVEKATSLEELATAKAQLQALRGDPKYLNYPQAFSQAERMILLKENGFRVDNLESRAAELQIRIGEVTSLEQATGISREIADLRAQRATGISIMDPERRALIDARLNTLQSQAAEVTKTHLAGLGQELKVTLEGMETTLQTAMNKGEIGQIFTDPSYMRMTTLLGFVQDPLIRQQWEQKMVAAVAANKQRVAQAHSLTFQPAQYEQAAAQKVASQILAELAREVAGITSTQQLQDLRFNPLTVQFLQQAQMAGSSVAKQAAEALQKLIDERRGGIEAERDLQKLKSGEVVHFNGVEFPIFTPPPPEFEVKTQVSRRGKITPEHRVRRTTEYLRALRAQHKRGEGRRLQRPEVGRIEKSFEVEFVDSRGRVYKPGQTVTEAEYDRFLQEQTVKARYHFETFPRNVPKPAADLKMTPWFIDNLARVADECNIQLENQEGILVIEGPAGCGKNFVIDTLAALSNREIFIVPCHSMMDKEDLTYTTEFDPNLGTVKKPSSLAEALETEGAIVVFNEWNTAPTGVIKLTNPLTDYMRTLFLALSGDKKSIKAKESVILLGVMNPIRYAGTRRPPEDASDRARIIRFDYPPEKDEATMVYGKINSLKKLQTEEFSKLWDYVVEKNAASGGDQFNNAERQQALLALKQLVKTANTIRKARKDFETNVNPQQEVRYDFSLRASKQIAIRLEREERKAEGKRRPIKEVIKDIILPKISNLEEEERIKTIIENT